jgi:hypothetical protein
MNCVLCVMTTDILSAIEQQIKEETAKQDRLKKAEVDIEKLSRLVSENKALEQKLAQALAVVPPAPVPSVSEPIEKESPKTDTEVAAIRRLRNPVDRCLQIASDVYDALHRKDRPSWLVVRGKTNAKRYLVNVGFYCDEQGHQDRCCLYWDCMVLKHFHCIVEDIEVGVKVVQGSLWKRDERGVPVREGRCKDHPRGFRVASGTRKPTERWSLTLVLKPEIDKLELHVLQKQIERLRPELTAADHNEWWPRWAQENKLPEGYCKPGSPSVTKKIWDAYSARFLPKTRKVLALALSAARRTELTA